MTDILFNPDVFLHRPVNEVLGLIPDASRAILATRDVEELGLVVAPVRILQGPEGARVLDRSGKEHGLGTRLVRFLQNLGYDESILTAYDIGLRKGEALVHLPCNFSNRRRLGDVLLARGAHAVVYFGNSSVETLSEF